KSLTAGSINRIANALRAALNMVADSDKRVSRHAWQVGLKAVPGGDVARNVILSADQVRRIVGQAYAINEAFGLLVEVAAVTGARVSQIARLTAGDIQANRVTMPSSRKGKGEKISHTPIPIPASLALKLKQAGKGRAAHDILLRKAPTKSPIG